MILEIRDIHKRFGGIVALKDLSFLIQEGEILGLIGPNGSGKTTVFNIITGVYQPDKGQIFFRGENITGRPIYWIARKGIARTFQATRLFFNLTVWENMRTVSEAFDQREKEESIDEILSLIRLENKTNRLASELTSAEQRRLMIAMGLCLSPRLLLLDEPTVGMNTEEVLETLGMIRSIRQKGCAILLIEHNMRAVSNICDRCIVLNFGQRIAEGSTHEIRKDRRVIEAYLGEEQVRA